MRVLDAGHKYELAGNKNTEPSVLQFFKDPEINGDGYGGTTVQEVLRALIERAQHLDAQVPGGGILGMVPVWRAQIVELEVRAAGRHGLCMFDQRRFLESREGVELEEPRPEDGHIYTRISHFAALCGGRCR